MILATIHLRASSLRSLSGLPTDPCVITKIVEAETIVEAWSKLEVGRDCYKLELTEVHSIVS